jgi:hypothetical protein
VGFVVDKMALGQVFSEYFGFPANLHSTNCFTITLIYHLGLYNRPEVAEVPGDVSPTPPKKKHISKKARPAVYCRILEILVPKIGCNLIILPFKIKSENKTQCILG